MAGLVPAIHALLRDTDVDARPEAGHDDGDRRRPTMLARDEDILQAAEDWRKAGRGVALATVVETWGSAPRPVGSDPIIEDQCNFRGAVAGGCVEGAVVTEALDVIESGKPRTLEFGVADETAWKVGLSCGGTIRGYVEKVEERRGRLASSVIASFPIRYS